MKKFSVLGLGVLALSPMVAAAQTLGDILGTVGDLIQQATPILVALALLYFFWGLAKYILAAGDEESKSEGRTIMIWGVIALFVIVSVWGLVQILQTTFGVQAVQEVTPPGVDVQTF